jgi:predicted RNA-binding protein YlxR (DUF448 family)
MSPNDTPVATGHDPERRCIISGERGSKAGLTRLALSPEGLVAPDVRARAPGRGAWIGVDRAAFDAALQKGKLKGALVRAFRTSAITVPDDLGAQIEANLQRAVLDRIGIESRSGAVLLGGEKIEQAARTGQLAALLHADDAAPDGKRKLDQAWRVGRDLEGSGATGLVLAANRAMLGAALGRDQVVHIGITDKAAATRLLALVERWHNFVGRESVSAPCETVSQGSSAAILNEEGL